MTGTSTRSTVAAIRPSLVTASFGFLGSTIVVTVLLVAFSQI
ncbi:hypothetical protein [Microvirga massiliensis]|nr:hypothetical protein [Microvirga massiliensis]